jgi:1-aminocyclopropane-1-carboxylate deaminase
LFELISEDEFLSRAEKVPLQRLNWPLAKQKDVDVLVRRDDLIDAYLSGNKFYKLFYNLRAAKLGGYQQLLSFGGAYSNHIFALAAAANDFGFKSVGVIRGERPEHLSPTLKDAEAWGMKLHFVSRADYRAKDSPGLLHELASTYGDFFSIPEGGANRNGLQGAKALGDAIYRQIKSDYTSVCLACGTANTLAGVAAGLAGNASSGNVLGFSVLKEPRDSSVESLGAQVIGYQMGMSETTPNWRIINGFHGGGYGRKLPVMMRQFMLDFEAMAGFQLDPVYTVKMCWGVTQLLAKDYWPRGSRLVLVHTGGLQGRRGFHF